MRPRLKIIPILLGLLTVALILTSALLVKTQNVYAAKDEKYKNLDTFTQVMHLIETNYVEDVENKTMVYGAIKGMLEELDLTPPSRPPRNTQRVPRGDSG